MKLALKVVLAVILGLSLVLAAFGYVRIEREAELFDTDMRRDHESLGRTLGVGANTAFRADGTRAVRELVNVADLDRPDLQISWIHPDGERSEPARANVRDLPRDEPSSGRKMTHRVVTGMGTNDGWLVSRLPVVSSDGPIGSIEIAESLAHRDRYIQRSIRNTILATVATILTSAGVVLLLGLWLIGRPLSRLTAKARRVGDGELERPLLLPQRDEVGELAREMNAMCERLSAAQERARAETAAKIQALEQLRHADRLVTVGQLAAGIAHELGTPLNVVAGRAKMIQTAPAEVAIGYAQIIAEQAERMAAIIRQLLDFARRRHPVKGPVDLATVVKSTCALLAHLADKKRIRIEVDAVEARTLGDSGQLEQVVTNLLVNAIFASPDGAAIRIVTGVVGLSEVPEAAEGVGGRLSFIRVEDEGPGMDADTQARIFEPFFTTKEVGQGSGLGLSVAHGIVHEHGGFIRVESQPGCGSTFWVYLPEQP